MSTSYVLVLASTMVLMLVLACINAYIAVQRSARRQQALLAKPNDDDEPIWTSPLIVRYCSISLAAGVFSALIGVGGSGYAPAQF